MSKNQPTRGGSGSKFEQAIFKETWNREILEWIMESIRERVDEIDIKFALVKKHGIGLTTARSWIKMCERLISHIDGGMSLDDAIVADREFRNAARRVKKVIEE